MSAVVLRHDKKSDKECQSPMLKIFKDIMQKNEEPEKTKLLNQKQKEERKKKKKSSASRVKSGEIIEQKFHFGSRSSVSEEFNPKSKMIEDKTFEKDYNQCRTKCYPFRGEKKESWWFWKEKSKSEDTCSCTSCALQNLFNAQCLGVCCLISVFVASVVFAFYLVFRTSMAYPMADNLDLDNMKLRKDANFASGMSRNRNPYNMKDFNGLGGYPGPDALDTFREIRNSEDADPALNELTSVLNNNLMKDDPNRDALRNFYKKIMQTDAQIQLLKKANQYNTGAPYGGDMLASKRVKRSVQLNDKNHHNKVDFDKKQKRGKRGDPIPTAFMIEKRKFVIEFNPAEIKHKVPKCSHAPKEQKSHEKQLKHPFYKNTQRLDELLDKLVEHNMRYDVADPLFLDKLLKETAPDERKKSAKSDADDSFFGNKPDIEIMNLEVATKATEGNEDSALFNVDKIMSKYGSLEGNQKKLTSPVDYDGVLRGSTFMNRIGYEPTGAAMVETAPNMRKLMQFDDGNEEEHDEEMFFDYSETQDENDQPDTRQKRMDYGTDNYTPKYKLPNLYNANWKGPMPLYPDEINVLIKQAAFQNLKVDLPKHFGDTTEKEKTDDEDEAKLSDTEYVDDNENTKYGRSGRMAQAYSDYGVLNSKRGSTEKNKEFEVTMKNLNFAMNKKLEPGRTKKDYNSDKNSNSAKGNEGFKFGISNTGEGDDKPGELLDQLRKHLKLVHDYSQSQTSSRDLPMMDATPSVNSGDSNGNNLLAIRRSLKSVDTDRIDTEPDDLQRDVGKNDPHVKILSDVFGQVRTMRKVNMRNDSNETGMYVNNKNRTEHIAADIGPAEFLSIISNWFQTFSLLFLNRNSTGVSKLRSNTTTNRSNVVGALNTKENVNFPNYNDGMIDNIAHRSRALLSVNEQNNVSEKVISKRANINTSGKIYENNAAKDIALLKNATSPTNSHATEIYANISTDNTELFSSNESRLVDNRTVIKRDVETNNNFLFWNDIYDDEYGVRTDPIDTSLRDKHSTNGSDVLKKSQRWFERKVKMLSDIIKKPKRPRSVDPRFGKSRRVRDVFRKEHGLDFRSLNDNMREVCREAVKSMQSTRNIEVRQDNKEYAVASSLMQQLVKLMSDLVDYQVQQKTCQKLPPDLHNFLEWLVVQNDEQNVPLKSELQFPVINDVSLDTTTIKDITLDNSPLRDALKSVQDLMKQYEGFSDTDKSKLTGVKEYLQNQLDYLQGQVTIGGDNMSSLYVNPYLPIRNRRNSKKGTAKNILQKYAKFFERKSSRSTLQDGGKTHSIESTTRKL